MAIEGRRKYRLVGTVFSVIGVVMLLLAGWTGSRQYNILKSWPTVEAEVVNSQVIRYHDAERGTMYRAAIDFRMLWKAQNTPHPPPRAIALPAIPR